MARKRPVNRSEKAREAQARRNIQWAALGVLVLAAVGVIWMVVSRQLNSTSEVIKPLKWDSAPAMTIDVNRQYFATVDMARGGKFVIQLFPDKAPLTVNNFVFLARQGFYNGVTFHRVLEGFMAQAGDPTGTGAGGPGYQFPNEDSDLTFDKPGVVAMANAGRDTNGSQFFITFAPRPQLNGGYTIFGQVVEGMDVVNAITRRNPDQRPTFPGDVILMISIEEM